MGSIHCNCVIWLLSCLSKAIFVPLKSFSSVFSPQGFFRQIDFTKIFVKLISRKKWNIILSSNSRPVRVIKFVSEESIEEGIYTIALEKLRLEQDLTNEEEENNDGEGTFFKFFYKDQFRLKNPLKVEIILDRAVSRKNRFKISIGTETEMKLHNVF